MRINIKTQKINKYNKMAIYRLKRKFYTQWDETDNLKRMKDADILAEKKKDVTNGKSIARAGITGAVLGSGVGGILGGFSKANGSIASKMGAGAKGGALIGAGIGAGLSYLRGRKQSKENEFYNSRLGYAKRQAARRERKDWKGNMINRDGYSY